MIEKSNIISSQLDEKELAKLPKFYASLALIEESDLDKELELLTANGIKISKASEIKVLTQSCEELQSKIGVLKEIGLTDIFVQDPSKLSSNAIEIYKRANYSMHHDMPIKDENGKYRNFLFNTKEWTDLMSTASIEVKEPTEPKEEKETPSVSASGEDDYFNKIKEELNKTRDALNIAFQGLDNSDFEVGFNEFEVDENTLGGR